MACGDAEMTELRHYGGIGIPEDQFRKAAEAMRSTAITQETFYEDLLDAALRSLWPGTGPMEVKDFEVRAG